MTDSGREISFDEVDKPGIANLLRDPGRPDRGRRVDLVEQFAGRGYGDLKGAVADAVTAVATPYRERTNELMAERTELETILAAGSERARSVASRTLADVYAKVGLY